MNKFNYKRVVYFIAITIVLTIIAQVYWNVKEYERNEHHFVGKVQLSLDNSVETYYANLTKSGIITFTSNASGKPKETTDTVVVKTNSRWEFKKKMDSTLNKIAEKENKKPLLIKNPYNQFPLFTADKSIPKNIDSLISKVFISISRDSLDLKKLGTYLNEEFKRNHIDVTYGLKYTYSQKIKGDSAIDLTTIYNLDSIPKKHLTANSRSTFLPHHSNLALLFTNETSIVLKKSLLSIFLSLLLSGSIIASLLFLLKTIYRQKQLSEIKNDLISNITHEFKTPIATISTALEALKNFNALNDKVKSEKYIAMANIQVDKLNIMVEKILETATLNHESLTLSKEKLNIVELVEHSISRYQILNTEKKIQFIKKLDAVELNLDPFHFENALGNIIDNALKYGGNLISVALETSKNNTTILISDNGKGIPTLQKEKVFEQFYRIPTGNTHNVKGFGIGLYYTKKIIEKHGGTIDIIYDKNNCTIFKIIVPNE